MDNALAVHALLVETAKGLDLPKAFHRDLMVHDLDALNNAPNGQELLWGIGENGTHMIRLDSRYQRGGRNIPYYVKGISGVDYWYVIKDGTLEAISRDIL